MRQSAASSSLAQWAAEQHQELLAARDLEALNKLAAGGTEDFIQYAMERIAALGDGTTKDTWSRLLSRAQEQAGIKKVQNTVQQYAAMLGAGEMAGEAFLSYLQGELNNHEPGSDMYTYLMQSIGDAKKWIDLSTRALEKRHDEEMAAAVSEGSVELEDALTYYKERRATLKAGDEAFGSLTKVIADITNAIQARDFNEQVNAAHARLIEEEPNDPVAANNHYLATIVKMMNSARDPEAQQKLFEQAQKIKEKISKIEILRDSQETNARMVEYFADKETATNMLQFLAQKAAEATDPAEGNRYASLAQTVIAHERQKAQDAIAAARRASSAAGGAGPGFSSEVINRALNPFEDAYKDALSTVERKIERGLTPTMTDWAILYEARSNYQNVIGQAYTQANATAKGTLDNTEREVREKAGSGTGWDFGELGDKMAEKILADIKAATDSIARIKGDEPELQAQAIHKQLADIMKAKTSPFVQMSPDVVTKQGGLDDLRTQLDAQVAGTIRDATDTILGNKSGLAIGKLSEKFDTYAAGVGRLDFEQWITALTAAEDARGFTKAIGDNVTPTQFTALKKLVAEDEEEQRSGLERLVAATQFRLPNGQIDPAWQAGGRLDESTRAANIQRILDNAEPPSSVLITAGDVIRDPDNPYFSGSTRPTFAPPPIGGPRPGALAARTDVMQPDASMGGRVVPGTDVLDATFTPPESVAPIDASIPQPAEADPWAAGGFLDESTRAALRASGFGAPDPHTAAWSFLNKPVDFYLPSFTLPDLPPEPAFLPVDFGINYGYHGGPQLTSGVMDEGPSFAPPPATSFNIPDDYAGGGSGPSEGGGGPVLTPY